MIPFARILSYGNKAPILPRILKIGASSRFLGALDDHGNIYVCGSEAVSVLGSPNTSWNLLIQNVQEAYFGTDFTSILYRTIDDIWYYVGYSAFNANSNITSKTPINVDAKMKAVFTSSANIVDLQFTGKTVMALRDDNNLYGVGYSVGIFGIGTAGVSGSSTFVLLASDCKKFKICYLDLSAYLSNSNILYAAGEDRNNSLLGSNRTTWFQYKTDVQDMDLNGRANVMAYSAGKWYTAGQFFATGGTFTQTQISPITFTNGFKLLKRKTSQGQCAFAVSTDELDTTLYAVGYSTVGTTGTGSTVNIDSYTPVIGLTSDEYDDIVICTSNSYLLRNGEIWGCGAGTFSCLPGFSTNQYTFQKLVQPI